MNKAAQKLSTSSPSTNNHTIDVAYNNLCDFSNSENEFSSNMDEESISPSVVEQKVTAVIALIDTATEDKENGIEHSKRCRRSSKLLFTKKVRVLLDSGSDGDIWFHRKEATKRFPYTERQLVKSYQTSAGDFRTKGQAKFELKFFEYSESYRYFIRPDICECDKLN